MDCLLVTNYTSKSERFMEVFRWLHESARRNGINLEQRTNCELLVDLAKGKSFCKMPVLFWDKDTKLCSLLEKEGYRTFNSSRAIEICDDKALTYLTLLGEVDQPKTIIKPKTFRRGHLGSFSRECFETLGHPVVYKKAHGSFGNNVRSVESSDELERVLDEGFFEESIIQEFVDYKADIRIQMVGDEVIGAMRRVPKQGDFRANIANGGHALPVQLRDEHVRIARKVMKVIGLDFAGVDLLETEDKIYLCEVNSNAHFFGMYSVTGKNVPDYIFKYIRREVQSEQ